MFIFTLHVVLLLLFLIELLVMFIYCKYSKYCRFNLSVLSLVKKEQHLSPPVPLPSPLPRSPLFFCTSANVCLV